MMIGTHINKKLENMEEDKYEEGSYRRRYHEILNRELAKENSKEQKISIRLVRV